MMWVGGVERCHRWLGHGWIWPLRDISVYPGRVDCTGLHCAAGMYNRSIMASKGLCEPFDWPEWPYHARDVETDVYKVIAYSCSAKGQDMVDGGSPVEVHRFDSVRCRGLC